MTLCVAAAAALRLVLAAVADGRLREFTLPDRTRRPVKIAGWTPLVVAIVALAIATKAPAKISDQYHRFINSGEAGPGQDIRQNVFSSANRGIVDN